MTHSKIDLTPLRDIRIARIIGIKETGRRISLRCPFPNHNDKSPSFTIYPDNGYNCFGCGANGKGAIDFAIHLGYTLPQAIKELQDYL